MQVQKPVEKGKIEKAQELRDELIVKGEAAARDVVSQPWVYGLTRLGYGVRGFLYLLVGLVAVQVAIGTRYATEDKEGAIAVISAQPFGKVMLIVIAAGLAGYALWGVIRAIFDPYKKGSGFQARVGRLGSLLSTFSYGALTLYTLRFIIGIGNTLSTDPASPQEISGTLLTVWWGRWVLAITGIAVIGAGAGQIIRAWRGKLHEQLDLYEMSSGQARWMHRLGVIGLAARGTVLALVGLFLLQAAWLLDPSKVKDLDGALQALAHQQFGFLFLGIIAAGLIAYGSYSLLGAIWFRIKTT